MKIMITILIIVIGFFYLADTTIQWKPEFKVSFSSLKTAIGIVLIVAGTSFISYDSYDKGVDNTLKSILKQLDEKIEQPQQTEEEINANI